MKSWIFCVWHFSSCGGGARWTLVLWLSILPQWLSEGRSSLAGPLQLSTHQTLLTRILINQNYHYKCYLSERRKKIIEDMVSYFYLLTGSIFFVISADLGKFNICNTCNTSNRLKTRIYRSKFQNQSKYFQAF